MNSFINVHSKIFCIQVWYYDDASNLFIFIGLFSDGPCDGYCMVHSLQSRALPIMLFLLLLILLLILPILLLLSSKTFNSIMKGRSKGQGDFDCK